MPIHRIIFRAGLLAGLLAVAACAEAQQAQRQAFKDRAPQAATQPEQAQIGDFSGKWVGAGSNALAGFYNRCGNGPLVQLFIQGDEARAVFRFTVKKSTGRQLRSEVFPLNGTIDDHGRLTLSDFQTDVVAVLSARDGTGDGSWETRGLACYGSFQVRRRP